jgi:hypothetical protein
VFVVINTGIYIGGCIQKFPDRAPGARTANGTAICHYVKLFRYFVSQSCEFCCHNHLCCFSTSVYCCCLFRYDLVRELLDTSRTRARVCVRALMFTFFNISSVVYLFTDLKNFISGDCIMIL